MSFFEKLKSIAGAVTKVKTGLDNVVGAAETLKERSDSSSCFRCGVAVAPDTGIEVDGHFVCHPCAGRVAGFVVKIAESFKPSR